MTMTTGPNIANTPNRQNHNRYGADLSAMTEADYLSYEDAYDIAKQPQAKRVGELVSGLDNNAMYKDMTEDWADPDPSKGIEGGYQLFQVAKNIQEPGYNPSDRMKDGTDNFLGYIEKLRDVQTLRYKIDEEALKNHYDVPTSEEALRLAMQDVKNDVAGKKDGIDAEERRSGTIKQGPKDERTRLGGVLKRLDKLEANTARPIGKKTDKIAKSYINTLSVYDNPSSTPKQKTKFDEASSRLVDESQMLDAELSLYRGIAELNGGAFVDKEFSAKHEASQKALNPNMTRSPNTATTTTTTASAPSTHTTPERRAQTDTDRLRALAYTEQKAVVHGRYERAVQSLAQVSGARSSFLGANRQNGVDASDAHKEFSHSIYEMMQYDEQYKGVLSNPDLSLEERGALVNAFYASKFNDLRVATASQREDNVIDKSANFINKHKTKLKIGAFVLGGLTGGVGGVILGSAISIGLNKASKHQIKKREAQNAADTGAAGTTSHIDTYSSLMDVNQTIGNLPRPHNIGPKEMQKIAKAAYLNLRKQHEKTVEEYREIHRKRSIGSLGVGLAWGGAVFAGGHMVTGFFDYQAHGSGGWMDKLNHLDDPNGPTPWKPTVDKPWWMNISGAAVATTAGTAAAGAVAYKIAKKKSHNQTNYGLAA